MMIETAGHAKPSTDVALSLPSRLRAQVKQDSFSLNDDFIFERADYRICFAQGSEVLRNKLASLVERMYGSRGLHVYHAVQDLHPSRAILVACRGEHLFGTLTLGLDSKAGLLADTLYHPQIDAVRAKGRKVCEVTRLAIDPEYGSHDVMASIFQLVYVMSRLIHGMTDLFIEVHPRHAGFYRRMLGYKIAGPEKICPRVGAPAVLLHLPLEYADAQLRQFAGKPMSRERNLYKFSSPLRDLAALTLTLSPASANC